MKLKKCFEVIINNNNTQNTKTNVIYSKSVKNTQKMT